MSAVISEQHRSRPAYIYVRQSTLAQVRHNQVWIGGVRKVAAPAELGVPHDVVGSLGERPDRPEVLGKHRDRGRHGGTGRRHALALLITPSPIG